MTAFAADFHSRMSPSSAERTLNCPGWVKLADQCGINTSSAAANEGTLAHHAAATCLTNSPNANYYIKHALPPDENGENAVKITGEMAVHVQGYVDYVVDLHNQTLKELEGCTALLEYHVEKRVGAYDKHKEAHGTTDNFTGRHFGPLHVVDFKYGVSPVKAKDNSQLKSYGNFALHELGDFDPVYLHIYQPRIKRKKPFSVWQTTQKDLLDFGEQVLFPAMKRAEKPGAPFKEGAWCWFCPAKNGCPIKQEKLNEQVDEFFDCEL